MSPGISLQDDRMCMIDAVTSQLRCFPEFAAPTNDNLQETGAWSSASVSVRDVSAGDFACAVNADDSRLSCFGSYPANETKPTASVTRWVAVSTGDAHACGIAAATRQLHCFGLGTASWSHVPVATAGPWASIHSGTDHTVAIAMNGSATFFGMRQGTEGDWPSAVTSWRRIEIIDTFGCGVESPPSGAGAGAGGALHCWGTNSFNVVSGIPADTTEWTDVSVSKNRACAVEASTLHMRCWGSGGSQLAHSGQGLRWESIAISSSVNCGIEAGSSLVKCVGPSAQQLGLPPGLRALARPVHCSLDTVDFGQPAPEPHVTHLNLVNASELVAWADQGTTPYLDGWDRLTRIAGPPQLQSIQGGMLTGATNISAVDLSRSARLTVVPQHALGTDTGSLVLVRLPNSVITIGSDAFVASDGKANRGLQPIVFPRNLAVLEPYSLRGLDLIRAIDLRDTSIRHLGPHALAGPIAVTAISPPHVLESISASAWPRSNSVSMLDFRDTRLVELPTNGLVGLQITRLFFPTTLTRIRSDAFNGTSIDGTGVDGFSETLLAANVTVLERHAFRSLDSISVLKPPNAVQAIEPDAFPSGALSLVEMDLSGTQVKTLVAGSLRGLRWTEQFHFPPTLQVIEPGAFPMSQVNHRQNLNLGNTQIEVLKNGTFLGLRDIDSISYPSRLRRIEPGFHLGLSKVDTFSGAGTLIEEFPTGCFEGAVDLKFITVPFSLRSIRADAFPELPAVTALNLSGSQITQLETDALRGLISLSQLDVPPTLEALEADWAPAPGAVASLDLSLTRIAEIPSDAFRGLSQLQNLALPPSLSRLAPGSLRGTMIISLDLQNSILATLETGLLDGISVEAILLPHTLRHIEAGAFAGQFNLQMLDLGDTSVTVLRTGSLVGLIKLKTLTLPRNLTIIEGYSFSVVNNVAYRVDLSQTSLQVLHTGALMGLSGRSFESQQIRFPPSFRELQPGSLAMSGAGEDFCVDLSATQLRALNGSSFEGLSGLDSVLLPPGLEEIQPGAFDQADSSINSLDLSRTMIQVLRTGSLSGLTTCSSLLLPASLQAIEANSMPTGSILSIDLRSTEVTELRTGALAGMRSLSTLMLPPGLTALQGGAFPDTSLLLSLDLSITRITRLPTGAFDGLSRLATLAVPMTLSHIDEGAMRACKALGSIDLTGTAMHRVQTGALSGMDSLTEVRLPSTLETIEPSAFAGAQMLQSVDMVGTAVTELVPGAMSGLTGNVHIGFPAGLAMIQAGAFNGSGNLTLVDLADTLVTALPAAAFIGARGIEVVRLPAGLAVLSAGVFREASVSPASLRIEGSGLVRIEKGAFDQMTQLPRRLQIVAPGLQTIDVGAFDGLESLDELHISAGASLAATGGAVNGQSLTQVHSCSIFEGLSGLLRLYISAPRARNIFGLNQDLAADGFEYCSFVGSIQELELVGLDLGLSIWNSMTFGALTSLRTLIVRESPGNTSFAIAGDFLTPLQLLTSATLENDGIRSLPLLSRSAGGVLESISLAGNPLDLVVENPFANLFKLVTVTVDLGKVCQPGTVKQPVSVLGGDDPAMCVVCPVGHYCDDGNVKTECTEGTYNPSQMASSPSACIECGLGLTTSAVGSSRQSQCIAIQLACSPGTAGLACDPCGPGTISTGGNVRECTVCSPGTVSELERLSVACDACPPNTYMPREQGALLGSCISCGNGLKSGSGSPVCSGCAAGSVLDATSGTCVEPPEACLRGGSACLPGVPQPIAAPATVSTLVAQLPLPDQEVDDSSVFSSVRDRFGFGDATSKGSESSVVQGTGGAARLLRNTEETVTKGAARLLRNTEETVALMVAGPRAHSVLEASVIARRLQSEDTSGSSVPQNPQGTSDVDIVALETGAWAISCSIIGIIFVSLLVPMIRPTVHNGLKVVDSMSTDHQPEQFAAVRRISTPTGGWCTVAALLIALASSSSLILEYAYRNYLRTAGLEVAATGVPGADRAATATANILFDILAQPASFVTCDNAILLTVSSGSDVVSSRGTAREQHSSTPSLLQLAATATMEMVQTPDGLHELCWLRASCDECGMPQTVQLELQAHWSVQLVGWRLAATDAERNWAYAQGTAVSPVADPSVANATALRDQMLDVKEESLNFVGHILDDDRGDGVEQRSGFRVQDTRVGALLSRAVTEIDPAASTTTLRIQVSRSPVFASTRVTRAFTFVQVVSSIVGLTVGILGAFTASFAIFERICGEQMVWMCGKTGRILTEEEAMDERITVKVTKDPGRNVDSILSGAPALLPKPADLSSSPNLRSDAKAGVSNRRLKISSARTMTASESATRGVTGGPKVVQKLSRPLSQYQSVSAMNPLARGGTGESADRTDADARLV